MAIQVNLDVMLARRKMSLTELSTVNSTANRETFSNMYLIRSPKLRKGANHENREGG